MRSPKKITKEMFEDGLAASFDGMISETEADAKYMEKDKLMTMDNLAPEVRTKINNAGTSTGGTGGVAYDDSELRSRMQAMEILGFKKGVDKVGEADLEQGLLDYIHDTTGADNTAEIAALQAGKADKTQLTNYRLNNVKLALTDLEIAVQNAIQYGSPALQAAINDIQTKMRSVNVAIGEADLDAALRAKISNAFTMANNSRQKGVPLSITDFDAALTEKLSEASGVSEAVFNSTINDIYDAYLDKATYTADFTNINDELGNRRKMDVLIVETDLDPALLKKLQNLTPQTVTATVAKNGGTSSVDLKTTFPTLAAATDTIITILEKTSGSTNWGPQKYASISIPPTDTTVVVSNSNTTSNIDVLLQVQPIKL